MWDACKLSLKRIARMKQLYDEDNESDSEESINPTESTNTEESSYKEELSDSKKANIRWDLQNRSWGDLYFFEFIVAVLALITLCLIRRSCYLICPEVRVYHLVVGVLSFYYLEIVTNLMLILRCLLTVFLSSSLVIYYSFKIVCFDIQLFWHKYCRKYWVRYCKKYWVRYRLRFRYGWHVGSNLMLGLDTGRATWTRLMYRLTSRNVFELGTLKELWLLARLHWYRLGVVLSSGVSPWNPPFPTKDGGGGVASGHPATAPGIDAVPTQLRCEQLRQLRRETMRRWELQREHIRHEALKREDIQEDIRREEIRREVLQREEQLRKELWEGVRVELLRQEIREEMRRQELKFPFKRFPWPVPGEHKRKRSSHDDFWE